MTVSAVDRWIRIRRQYYRRQFAASVQRDVD